MRYCIKRASKGALLKPAFFIAIVFVYQNMMLYSSPLCNLYLFLTVIRNKAKHIIEKLVADTTYQRVQAQTLQNKVELVVLAISKIGGRSDTYHFSLVHLRGLLSLSLSHSESSPSIDYHPSVNPKKR